MSVCNLNNGERGIRTLGTVSRTPAFQASPLSQLGHLSTTIILYHKQVFLSITLFA